MEKIHPKSENREKCTFLDTSENTPIKDHKGIWAPPHIVHTMVK